MTGMLVEGEWKTESRREDEKGRFIRPASAFRDKVTANGSSGYKAEPHRYHLYISLACPWAHRTAIMRKLKGLEWAISMSVLDPVMGEESWAFSDRPGCIPDTVTGASYLHEIYTKADPNYTGRVSTPVLWDKKNATIVNNESREVMWMLDTQFEALTKEDASFYPEDLREEIERSLDELYEPVNNGVYRAGFATEQVAYEEAVTELFDALDRWEEVLGRQRYLCGDRITEADWAFFTTLVRFDPVYHGHFKCNFRRIVDHPNLWGYLKDLYQQPGIAETVNLDHIKRHYYISHKNINPTAIVPKGPILNYEEPHNRQRLPHKDRGYRSGGYTNPS